MENLVRAEIIYMGSRVDFFVIHWYVGVEETEYVVVRELTHEEADRLIRGLSNIRFRYTILLIPASVSAVYSMQGYAIKLYYDTDIELPYGQYPFIIVAQTGDYGYGMRRLAQVRAGRTATDEDWNILMSELYFEGNTGILPGHILGGVVLILIFAVTYINKRKRYKK